MRLCSTEELHAVYLSCQNKVCTDTRNIESGSLFFCLRGANFNGNTFANEALKSGAAYVVSDDTSTATSDKILLVENTTEALQQLAAFHRKTIKTHVFAIGGSNGKTTTKELCIAVSQKALRIKATTANLNNHIGVPLTLLQLNGNEDLAIVELGTNHPGEMALLCDLTNPDSGVITNIGKEHLEGFGDMEGVAKEESALFLQLIANKGKALVNLDDPWLASMQHRLPDPLVYSVEKPSHLQGRVLESMPFLKFEFNYLNQGFGPFTAQLGGVYNLYNILAAIGLGIIMGLDPEKCATDACAYKPANNRSEWLQKGNRSILLDAYNANPSSMEAALREFAELDGTRAVFLGDMLEMGDVAAAEHRHIFDLCKALAFEETYFCGADFSGIAGSYPHVFPDSVAMAEWLKLNPSKSKYALIKGSRGMKMERVREVL